MKIFYQIQIMKYRTRMER